MALARHFDTFHGLPVLTLPELPGQGEKPLPAAGDVAWRLDCASDVPFAELWRSFTDRVPSTDVRALVIGPWWDDGYSDPRPVHHDAPRVLRFESGGLPRQVVRAIGACELPAPEHLELWLGAFRYGGDATVADLAPLLARGRFPALRHLGLRSSKLQNEIAAAVAAAPVVAQLESLSLSMGALTDSGAEALLGGRPLTPPKRLDPHHHFLSEPMADRVRAAFGSAGTEVDLSEHRTPRRWRDEEWRHVAVSE